MARGARKSAAAVRELVSSLQAAAPSRKLPSTLTALHFVVPRKFHDVRTWELMRRELPRLVYANPELQVRVDPLVEHAEDKQSHASLQVHFQNMPSRTIAFGDKSSSEIIRELMTMGQFAQT